MITSHIDRDDQTLLRYCLSDPSRLTFCSAQVLIYRSPFASVIVYASVAMIAGLACLLLPIETRGRPLQSTLPGSELQ